MSHPWQYYETIQIGTDYSDPKEVAAYDQLMQKLRDVNAEAHDIQKALSLSTDSIVWEIDGIRSQAGDEVTQQTIQHIKAEFSTFDWILEEMIACSSLKIVEKENKGFLTEYVCEK